jgi:RNA polymerase sigma-70 factor (TIGR02957 family)
MNDRTPFEDLRPRAFAIAYRMLGSVSEAEDVVQEALLRLHRTVEGGERIESPEAYLTTVVTRLAIDELRSARARRERYVGEWLPEPILVSEEDDPAQHAEIADSLSLAFLVLLETLTAEQRAVLLLRDVFEYPYDEIAAIIGKSPEAVRQLAVRARRRVEEGRPRFESSGEQRERLASRFFAAFEQGDLGGLESLLAEDVELHGDGGGKAPALARPVHGRTHVARTLVAWGRAGARLGGFTLHPTSVNGQPGALVRDPDDRLINVMAVEIAGGRVRAVRSIVNPDKLGHLGPLADLGALRGRRAERRTGGGRGIG